MAKVVKLQAVRTNSKKPTVTVSENTFTGAVREDISKLMEATGLSEEEAVRMAKQFYKKYPMLMEFVRSPEVLLDKREDSMRLLNMMEKL